MAFGGSSTFSFGNNNNTSSTFGNSGGFGSNNNTTGGFGSGSTAFGAGNNSNTTAFGSNNTGGSTFGGFGSANNNTSSGGLFGSTNNTGGAFGASSNTGGGLFGNNNANKPSAFGTSTTGGFGSSTGTAFGSNTGTSTGFGGFGQSNNNNTTTTGAFGSQQSKPLFGANGTGTTSTFGSTGGFGSNTGLSLGGNVPACPGTGAVGFAPTTEKESATSNATVAYQTITFQDPYKPYSLEELRLADYSGGRQFGNGSGTAGAFGASAFGGGFGTNNTSTAFGANNNTNTGGGLFGNTAGTGSAFGSDANKTGAFGSTTTGGLFGQNKPSGGLFGAQPAATTATSGGGLFGTANNTASTGTTFGGFGQQNNQQSGGLFGASNQQNKPAGSLFGGTNTNTNTTGGFSFGNNANNNQSTPQTGGLFGNNQNNTQSGGLFGNTGNTQNTTTPSLFGNNTNNNSNSLFGNKPATTLGATTGTTGGLFGSTATNTNTGGLFGNNNQQNQTGNSLFGNNTTNNTQGGGLFGNTNQNQNKPGGLFGNTNTASTGGGLFSNTNNNQQGSSLFGNNNQQQQTGNTGFGAIGGSSLFGGQNNQNKPGGLFASTTNNNQGGSLFGGNNSLFGQSQNTQQQQIPGQQEVKHASLLDPNPYGQSTIWMGLPQPTADNSKPLFTPLTATKKLEESARKPLPNLKLNQSRYMTPPRRNGFGLSYSTYGTPSSVASTPGGVSLSGSAYGGRGWTGGSFGRSFNRSASVQNLRTQYATDADDIWKPNAFAPSHRNSSGSIKRLTIDRSIRQDLFNRPQPVPALPAPAPGKAPTIGEVNGSAQAETAYTDKKLRKSVSFEGDAQDTGLTSETGALQRTENSDDEEETPRRPKNGNGNSGLEIVPEDRESHPTSSKSGGKANSTSDPKPGEYWMKPSRRELSKMDRSQLTSYKGFQVGREGCGFVIFEGSVDLTSVNLEESDLFEKTVEIHVRSVTVYPDPTVKPPVGRGLNVPSTITIDNSWPRSKGKPVSDTSGPIFEKHINRLKRIPGTEFVSYDAHNGRWVFKVPHYTRYGLDYDDADTTMDQSELSLPPQSIDKSADISVMEVDDESDDEDTFDFKKSVPGQFGKKSVIPSDDEYDEASSPQRNLQDSDSEHSAYSEDEMMSDDEQSPSIPGSLPPSNRNFMESTNRSPTRLPVPGTPGKPLLDLEGDWAEQLQRTISPRKQNRDVLREAQSKVLLDKVFSPIKPKASAPAKITSSIDIMNSIFKSSKKASKAAEPDFEV